jgi:hypothetical protein
LQAYFGFPVAFDPFLMTWSVWQSGQWRMTYSSAFQICSLTPCYHSDSRTTLERVVDLRTQIISIALSTLADELKTGDVCVEGSAAYAEFRTALLPWEECEPMVPAAQYG